MAVTIEEAKAELRSMVKLGGAKCPVCTQFVKVYKRKLNAQMARWLIGCVKVHSATGDWVHVDEIGAALGLGKHAHPADFAKLRYWGLIVERPNDDATKRTSGYWQPTENGKRFVYSRFSVPSHVLVYDGTMIRHEGEAIGISKALGRKFDYKELMRELPEWRA